jgi:exonuclease-1
MGCPGMLKELRGATERKWPYVRKCRGSTIGVDLFIWLHQEIMNFFRDVVEHGATSPDYSSVLAAIKERVVRYVISGIRLFFVIDGRRLPGKYGTDAARAQRRAQAQAHIDAAVAAAGQRAAARRTRSANGRAATTAAVTLSQALADGTLQVDIDDKTLRAAVAVTDALVTEVICMLRTLHGGCTYVKAPYEADAQLACLDALDVIQYVMTEDGDLVTYGCRRVLLKVDRRSGTCDLLTQESLSRAPVHDDTPLLQLCRKWTPTAILPFFAAVSSCDYSKGDFPGWGPKLAANALKKVRGGKADLSKLTPMAVARAMQLLKAAVVPADASSKISACVDVFWRQVVYHPIEQCDMPLDAVRAKLQPGEWDAVPAQCGECAVEEDVLVKNSDEDSSIPIDSDGDSPFPLPRPVAHAMGFIESRDGNGRRVPLPAVTAVVDTATRPTHLTADMVAGAEIRACQVTPAIIAAGYKAGGLTAAELHLFLLCRGQDHLSGNSWAKLAQKVHDQLVMEAAIEQAAINNGEEPPPLKLRDRDGTSVVEHLIQRRQAEVAEFPELDGELKAPAAGDAGWSTDQGVIANSLPGLSEEMLQSYFKALGTESDANARVLERGYQHIEALTSADFKFHPTPLPSRPNVQLFEFRCPASFCARAYLVTIFVETDLRSSRTIKPIVKVLRARCLPTEQGGTMCRASGASHTHPYGMCTHCSACLQIVRNFPRLDLSRHLRGSFLGRQLRLLWHVGWVGIGGKHRWWGCAENFAQCSCGCTCWARLHWPILSLCSVHVGHHHVVGL